VSYLKFTFNASLWLVVFFLLASCADTNDLVSTTDSDPHITELSSEAIAESSSSVEIPEENTSQSSSSIETTNPEASEGVSSEAITDNSSSSRDPFERSSSSMRRLSSSSLALFSSSSIASSNHSVYQPGDFILGADISKFQEYEARGVRIYDTDGQQKNIFEILKNHGFNFIRLKTFVDPASQYGYAAPGCGETSSEAFGDKAHILAYAKKIKGAGMGFLLDFHYSDNWADPGKQIIPERFRSINNIDELADSIYAYTYDVLNALNLAGTLPDMVHIGNEITDGLLRNLPVSNTNCWGEPSTTAPASVSAQLSKYPSNFAKIINAGLAATKAVSPEIITSLHIESPLKHGSWWLSEVAKLKLQFDVIAFSAYTAYNHGTPPEWKTFIQNESKKHPHLKFLIAEYSGGTSPSKWTPGASRATNLMLKEVGAMGSFYWEPALSGEWGAAAFEWKGNSLYAKEEAFSEFDGILDQLELKRH